MIIIAINNSSGINSSELQRKEQTFVKRNEGRWTGLSNAARQTTG